MTFLQLFRKTKSNEQYQPSTVKNTLVELVFFIVFLVVVSISINNFSILIESFNELATLLIQSHTGYVRNWYVLYVQYDKKVTYRTTLCCG